ncbi:MAG: ATP-binding protein, partial [Candidatus Omnitrophica bacterium]|nr:ATP-binding protein [Candidatus Omnitrophota bacterium]MBU1997035.1 ATP-binding protein [Candidatus Omnitrophota bacterium]
MSYIDLENSFFGRTKTLDLLKRRVIDLKEGYRQNIAILGNQFVGKTSLLHHFIANLDERDVTVVYLDFENKDFGYFMSKLIGSLLYNYSKKNNLSLHDDINLLLETTKDHIPNTVQVIRKIQKDFGKGKVSECYLGLLTLPEVFTNETEQFCVLVLDEFQNIDNFMIPDAFINLGKKIMTQKKCLYIVSSSFPSLAQKILSEKLSLLFGNFEIVDIDAFGLATSQKFIDQNLKGIKIGVQLRGFLTDFAGGHPLY